MVDQKALACAKDMPRALRGAIPLYGMAEASDLARALIAADAEIARLTVENRALRGVCGEAYQLAGAIGAPVKALDNLGAVAGGREIPHKTFLPVLNTDCYCVAELLLAVEGARKAIEDAPHVGCGHQTVSCFEPPDKPCGWGQGGVMCKTHRSDGFPCNCWKSRTLALLPAPGAPLPLEILMRKVARLQEAVDAEQGDAPTELENELRDAVESLCALVKP